MNGGEHFDGEAGETYIAPASNRKGRRELPGWRDPDWSRQNWQYVRRVGRRYIVALMVPGLAFLWASGYAKGLLDGAADCLPAARPPEIISKESRQ